MVMPTKPPSIIYISCLDTGKFIVIKNTLRIAENDNMANALSMYIESIYRQSCMIAIAMRKWFCICWRRHFTVTIIIIIIIIMSSYERMKKIITFTTAVHRTMWSSLHIFAFIKRNDSMTFT